MTAPPNPPAFPIGDTHFAQSDRHGMTLRDWFAGQALAEIMRQSFALPHTSWAEIADNTYAMADAMLAERARTTGEDAEAMLAGAIAEARYLQERCDALRDELEATHAAWEAEGGHT